MAKQDLKKIFFNGIITENPTFRLVLGMCPTLAVTTSVLNGLGMGLATAFVLVCSNLVISLLRNFIPSKVRIPAFIVVIASFVTIVQLVLNAFLPDLASSLGLFIPLIVVNCIIFARAEAFASKNGPLASMTDGLGMGLGFTVSLTLISAVRELIGSGTLLGFPVLRCELSRRAVVRAGARRLHHPRPCDGGVQHRHGQNRQAAQGEKCGKRCGRERGLNEGKPLAHPAGKHIGQQLRHVPASIGTCPFLGVSKKVSTALGMGVAVTFVMGVASLVTYLVQYYILVPLKLEYLQTIAFILVIAVLVQLVEMVINKTSPSLYKALGVYLPLITTNCAVLGVTILNITESYSLLGSVVNGVGSALGFTLAIVLFAGVRERLENSNIPPCFEGIPVHADCGGLDVCGVPGLPGSDLTGRRKTK